ncbi:MAG: VWA domain-containing protein [Pseudomonadota bacterium]
MTVSLAYPMVLLLLPLPYLIWRFAPPHLEPVTAIRVPFFRQITAAAGSQTRAGAAVLVRTRFQIIVAGLVWCLVILSLAKPERLGDPVVIETSARDIVLALDVSGSMDERDFIAPDGTRQQRLSAVKQVMSGFIANRDSDRMALIIFGTRAFVQAPFTEDLQSLQGFLDQIEVGLAGPNTALGDAIGLAIRTFDASDVEERVLILLSDGADTSSRMSPANAAAIAAERGVTIHTIGVGDPDASGEDKVDLPMLQNIASTTGGAYFFAGDQAALRNVYAEIDRLNPRVTESKSFRPRESLVHVPLGLATLLVLAGISVMSLWQRHRVHT